MHMKLSAADLIRLVDSHNDDAPGALAALGGVEGVADALCVSLDHGLDERNPDDIQERERLFGKNFIEPEPAKTLFRLMWHAFKDVTLIILTAAGVLSIILSVLPLSTSSSTTTRSLAGDLSQSWIEGVAILFAVAVVTLVSAINEYQKEKQFRALNAVKEDEKIKVIRNGVPAEVSKFDLVVGDIVRVDLGDIIPADGLVFDETDLKLDESAMTGETILIHKDSKAAPFLLSGTKVMEGVGKMLVICVGENAQAGIISKLILSNSVKKKLWEKGSKQDTIGTEYSLMSTPREEYTDEKPIMTEPEPSSPLQGKLNRLAIFLSKLGLSVAIFVFVALVVRFSIVKFWINHESWDRQYVEDFVSHFILGVTILVLSLPEGLPLAVTIALAFSVREMLKDNNLVRHLDACETMGSATTICSDKTGTLTTNRMTVVECYLDTEEFSVASSLHLRASATTRQILCDSICINSTAEILPPKQVGAQPEHTGNKTECALLQFAADMGVQYAEVRKSASICHMITFSSAKKRMSVVIPLS
ncbi:unnamed protein product, partial [Aphanomyces euteiches]